jgi:acyl-CoA synthetase (AMP-forming)/AMP-acid ligase II
VATVSPPWVHGPEGRRRGKLRSAGRASYCADVRVVDLEGQVVPSGTVGEIVVRGPNVMRGYWNKPEQTADAVRDGWMHTGDGGYLDDDGFLFVVDRMKDVIISGGENVYSAEVENALAQHPAVASCAVIGIPSAEWGEAVHAVVVLHARKEGVAAVTAEELIAHCRSLIASYKRPRSVDIRDSLPMSGAGKILKSELRKAFWKEGGRNVA